MIWRQRAQPKSRKRTSRRGSSLVLVSVGRDGLGAMATWCTACSGMVERL